VKTSVKIFHFIGAAALVASAAFAQRPDNTKMNKGDGDQAAPTADHQKMNVNDRELTQKIRKSVMADKALSTYAHNVKIISQNGKVTLRGPVKSDEEKKTVEAKAIEVAGSADRVDDQISVKSN
jgi:hyperosmotically inducible protein